MSHKPVLAKGLLRTGPMEAISARLQIHDRYLAAVRGALPDFLGSHCQYCVVKGDRLVLYVESPVWGSQLRFYSQTLLITLEQSMGVRFREIQVRNLLPKARPQAPPFVPPSPRAAACLRAGAENAPSAELRDALLRLSQTVEKLARGQK